MNLVRLTNFRRLLWRSYTEISFIRCFNSWAWDNNWLIFCFQLGVTDEDDSLVTLALNNGVFSFLNSTFIRSEVIQNEVNVLHICNHNLISSKFTLFYFVEEFYMRRIHSLFTDFIVLMPLKVKELKVRAEEISRTSQMYAQVSYDYLLFIFSEFSPGMVTKIILFAGRLESTRKHRTSLWNDDKKYDSSVQSWSFGTEIAFGLLVRW